MTNQATLLETISKCASKMNSITGDWMLFGGAAMALHGLSDSPVSDIDVVSSVDSVKSLADKFVLNNQADCVSERFRSSILLKLNDGPIPVEIMGGFEVFNQHFWEPVHPVGYDTILVLGEPVNLASRSRLREIFELCGREKDLIRVQKL